jgi:hypothetical protein
MNKSLSERNKRNVNVRWNKQYELLRKHIENFPKDRYLLLKTRLSSNIAGDGSVSVRKENKNQKSVHYTISFYPDEMNMLNCFLRDFEELYLKKPTVKNMGKYYTVRVDSKFAVLDLLEETNYGSLEWKLPENLLKNKKLKVEWLKAFFDCESHVAKSCIQLQSVNQKGINQIKGLLEEIGISCKIYSYERKNKNWNTNYILCIMSKEERLKYLDRIGFNNLKKLKSLKETLYARMPELVKGPVSKTGVRKDM